MIGRTLKNYVVEEMLGKGGMGVVYRALDTRLNRRVALKVLPPELVRDDDRRRRFVQEARAASAVNHPAIAQIYEIEEDDENVFIVMEFVDGSTVRELVGRKELDLNAALEVGIQVADALARAHEAGIVHRDIKSDNVMVTRDGHPKILDFGLAKLLDPMGDGATVSGINRTQIETLARTQAGMIMGTVAYMSPEQARGLPADRRSDIFSFGIVMFEMVTGRLPFEGGSALDTMHAIAYEQTQAVTSLRSDVPWSLQRVIERCLQKKPEDRYQDLRQAVTDLKGVKRGIESGVSSGMPVSERLRGWVGGFSTRGVVWAALGGAIIGGLIFALLLNARQGIGSVLFVAGIGALLYRRFRNRGQREMRRFVKKTSAMKEVRLVSFHDGQFTVVADKPTAKSYLKLNALLTTANQRLFRGEPMTMIVREDIDAGEMKKLLSSPGVQFLRDDASGARRRL
ncbi:MAG TPA: serine/threonine-protein kinase [Patescibacteria group bacterium]|nr:serine/threonine-protein kinase [Patescibacteria group bacterium]